MFFAPVSSTRRLNGSLHPYFARGCAPVARERLLDEVLQSMFVPARGQAATWERDDKGYRLSMDVPGLAREHLTLTIKENLVKVESKADAPRTVNAAWQFPEEIDAAGSSAKLENGVLTLVLARKTPVDNSTVIAID